MTLSPLDGEDQYKRIDFELEFDPDPDNLDEADKPQQNQDEDEDDYYDRLQEWEDDIRTAVQPEPGNFEPPKGSGISMSPVDHEASGPKNPDFKVDLVRDYADRGLQVIVKLANIELTPEKPEYGGGTWHVEGQLVRLHFALHLFR
jgi:hypothetical protein